MKAPQGGRSAATPQLAGLIGWPVEHSLSPAMHNAAFRALGLDWLYLPLPVEPDNLPAAVRGLGALGFRGANVTAPHKETVVPYLDRLSEAAQAIGAVNTILVRDGQWIGHNTDADGFAHALGTMQEAQGGSRKPGGATRNSKLEARNTQRAVVLGAGGGARAVVYSLLQSGVGEVLVLNRNEGRAGALVSALQTETGFLRALPLTKETLVEAAGRADLLVNATTVGMWPEVEGSLWPEDVPVPAHLLVVDLVYNPLETRLLQQARRAGARTLGGLEMLVRQGALAFEAWTGVKAPVDVMRAAALADGG